MRRIAITALALPFLASACGSFGETLESSPTSDGGIDAATTSDGGSGGGDAGADASDALPGCVVAIEDEFDTLDPAEWEAVASASDPLPRVAGGELELVGGDANLGGLVRWKTALSANRMRVEVTFRVQPAGGTPGDALAVAWLKVGAPFTLGPQGPAANLCGSGNQGGMVYISTFEEMLRVSDMQHSSCGTGGVALATIGGNAHDVTFEVAGQQVAGSYDGSSQPFSGTVAQSFGSANSFFFVLSASTGGDFAAHYVQRVRVTLCN